MITFENRFVQTLIEIAESTVTNVDANEYVDRQGCIRAFEAKAKEQGYVKLGSGYFSQAWTHPEIKHYAIKLGFKKEDSGAAYAAFCRDNQHLAGIPKIYGLDRYSSCYVVLMDKLIAYDKVSLLYYAKKQYHELSGKPEVIQPSCIKHFSRLQRILSNWRTPTVESEEHELYHTAKRIYDFFQGIASFDMHAGNVMVDKYGQLIITDPVSFVKTCKKEHHEIQKVHAAPKMFNAQPDFRGRVFPEFGSFIHDEFQAVKWNSCPKRTPKIERGAHGAAKPAFLVAKDARNVFKKR